MGTFSNNWYRAKNKFAFIPQRIPKWHGTLLENLLFFATIHGITGEQNLKQIDYILFRLGLDKFRDLTWNQISSGYRMRFELAKMLLWRPHLLILDEPLANLDINAQQLFLQDLKFFAQSQTNPISIILSSQQLHEIERIADNIIFIRQGKTIYNGKQINFGVDRNVNNYEVAGNLTLQQLQNCLTEANGGASRTFVACDDARVVGYYALAASAVAPDAATGRFRRNMPDPVPVAVLGRLAIDKSFQGMGLGRALFRDAALRVLAAADSIGIRGMLVHAISNEAKAFYVGLGSDVSPFEPMTLMATVADLKASLRP